MEGEVVLLSTGNKKCVEKHIHRNYKDLDIMFTYINRKKSHSLSPPPALVAQQHQEAQ